MTPTSQRNDGMISAPRLRERGWTDAMIRDLLGEPDRYADNPIYRSAAPMRLWSEARVEQAERSEAFAAWVAKAAIRKAAGRAAAEALRARLLDTVSAITVTVPEIEDAELARLAVEHRNDYMAYHPSGRPREDFESATVASASPDALARWKVNYLRHQLTNYEEELAAVYGKVGVRDAVELIREKVLDAIAEAYPDLAAECIRQEFRDVFQ